MRQLRDEQQRLFTVDEAPANHQDAPARRCARCGSSPPAAIGAVVHLLATAIEEGRDPSSMSGILAGSFYRLLLA